MRILVVCVLAALFFVVVPGDAKKQRRKRARCSVNDNFNQLTVESTIEVSWEGGNCKGTFTKYALFICFCFAILLFREKCMRILSAFL